MTDMEENPYKSSASVGATRKSPQRWIWVVILCGSALFWLTATAMIATTMLGYYDPRRDDRLPAGAFSKWCVVTGIEWILFGALVGLAIVKLLRRSA